MLVDCNVDQLNCRPVCLHLYAMLCECFFLSLKMLSLSHIRTANRKRKFFYRFLPSNNNWLNLLPWMKLPFSFHISSIQRFLIPADCFEHTRNKKQKKPLSCTMKSALSFRVLCLLTDLYASDELIRMGSLLENLFFPRIQSQIIRWGLHCIHTHSLRHSLTLHPWMIQNCNSFAVWCKYSNRDLSAIYLFSIVCTCILYAYGKRDTLSISVDDESFQTKPLCFKRTNRMH